MAPLLEKMTSVGQTQKTDRQRLFRGGLKVGDGSARERLAISSPGCHKSLPISSESQASSAPGGPAGAAGPACELLSASAQMALRC